MGAIRGWKELHNAPACFSNPSAPVELYDGIYHHIAFKNEPPRGASGMKPGFGGYQPWVDFFVPKVRQRDSSTHVVHSLSVQAWRLIIVQEPLERMAAMFYSGSITYFDQL